MQDIDFYHHPEVDARILSALSEDIGPGDYTSEATIPDGALSRARCLIKEPGILAGVAAAERVAALLDARLHFQTLLKDGTPVLPGDIAFIIEGPARSILGAERLMLNILQRMSGIATRTHGLAARIADLPCKLLDTRKTTPNFRVFEKWAVKIGGGENHRYGLYDMILIKDNHIDFAGGVKAALSSARLFRESKGLPIQIEIETRNLSEVQQVLDAGGADRILLDNMTAAMMKEAVQLIAGGCKTEASGNIDESNIREKALSGVNYLSMGALTHSVRSLDISLKAY